MPTVSVVIPCYNAARYVGRTLDSLLAQTLTDWECVVVDDGSSDDSAEVVALYAERDTRITLLRGPNGGVCHARNRGFAHCSAESPYLLFLDADDCLVPKMLDEMATYLNANSEVGLVYCGFVCIDEHDEELATADERSLEIVRYVPSRLGVGRLPPMVAETPLCSIYAAWAGLVPSNSVLRRSAYQRTGGWDEMLGQGAEDTDVSISIALNAPVHFISRQLVRYRRHAGQSSSNRTRGIAQERKLHRKWSGVSGSNASHEAALSSARRFHDRQVVPYLWVVFGTHHLRTGRLIEGLKCYLRSIRQLLRQPA